MEGGGVQKLFSRTGQKTYFIKSYIQSLKIFILLKRKLRLKNWLHLSNALTSRVIYFRLNIRTAVKMSCRIRNSLTGTEVTINESKLLQIKSLRLGNVHEYIILISLPHD